MIPALRDELSRFRTIPFSRFMELALYAPGEGYYERDPNAMGPQGDFYTSVTAYPLFAELLGLEMANWLGQLPRGPWQLVEAGAHNGVLASGILRCLANEFPALAPQVTYIILEPSSRRREWQKKMLEDFAGVVRWAASWEEVSQSGVRGVVFSNELLDAMPLRRVGWDASARRWFEWGVSLQGEQLGWERLALTQTDCAALFLEAALECPSALEKVLPDGFTLDLSPTASQWWEIAARHLQAGWLLTFDYGLTSDEFWAPSRPRAPCVVIRNIIFRPRCWLNPVNAT